MKTGARMQMSPIWRYATYWKAAAPAWARARYDSAPPELGMSIQSSARMRTARYPERM
jgi:hypothetical protein